MKAENYQISALEKLANSKLITKIYPMIDEISVLYVEGTIWIRINLKDPGITKENMYEKGFDPHYLIDYHIKKLMKYLGFEKYTPVDFVVYDAEGKIID
jgi:hypothetical protein